MISMKEHIKSAIAEFPKDIIRNTVMPAAKCLFKTSDEDEKLSLEKADKYSVKSFLTNSPCVASSTSTTLAVVDRANRLHAARQGGTDVSGDTSTTKGAATAAKETGANNCLRMSASNTSSRIL